MHYLEVVFFNIIKMKVNTNEIQWGVENTFFSPFGTKYRVFPADDKSICRLLVRLNWRNVGEPFILRVHWKFYKFFYVGQTLKYEQKGFFFRLEV